ncbi:N-acetylmuramidase domain-containing protein [Jeongeupia naejangsanensis]|uniref:N-acetylmuramidase domain-containing protein n=1 Tax=Jeongeupia naejangsanensis TaxID=613195 RepID=UPI001EF14D6B|nr:N-acetylmuramidase domain-containing protein [Jeongeupia naejangsanensis]
MVMTLRNGDQGQAVRDLQRQLIATGYRLNADGWYGESTESAVRRFQQSHDLVADGLAGPKTLQTLRAGGADPRLMTGADLQRAADLLGVPLACIQAVNAVESRGSGFLDDGRPVILYERHIMYRQLEKAGHAAAAIASRYPDLVNTARGGYAGGSAEYVRLANARRIDDACALEACSWGAFQVMGYHWQALGYASINEFVERMQRNEGDHLEAFCRFVLSEPALIKALRGRKWADFARGYNGAAYRENLYDVKLARAYEQFTRVAA